MQGVLAMTTRWTSDKPTRDGIYWVRSGDETTVVEVAGSETDAPMCYALCVDVGRGLEDFARGITEWYGPLEAPP